MSFNPRALDESTLKQFVDRLHKLHKASPCPSGSTWPPKRSTIQEEVARMLGFPNWHHAITAIGQKEPASTSGSDVSTSQNIFGYREAPLLTPAAFDHLLAWGSQVGASDIIFQSGELIEIRIAGKLVHLGTRRPTKDELQEIIGHVVGENWEAGFARTAPVDMAYQIKSPSNHASRFFLNVTSFTQGENQGWTITCRLQSVTPPSFASLGIEGALCDALTQLKSGLVLVSGQTGSGKSTLLAAIVRQQLEINPGKIVTYENPIEFNYATLNKRGSVIQHAVPGDVPSFQDGIKNALRRNASTIMLGETRDSETLKDALVAAHAGCRVLTSMVASGVADTFVRLYEMSKEFTPFSELVYGLSAIVSQVSVPGDTDQNVVLREILILDDPAIEYLNNLHCEPSRLGEEIKKLLASQGQGILLDARQKFALGLISADTLKRIERQFS